MLDKKKCFPLNLLMGLPLLSALMRLAGSLASSCVVSFGSALHEALPSSVAPSTLQALVELPGAPLSTGTSAENNDSALNEKLIKRPKGEK